MNLDLRPMLRGETNRISMDFLLEPDELYGVSFGDGIHVVGEVTNQGGYIRLVATADVPYTGECARCLDPVSGVFSLPFERTVVTEGTLTEEQEEENVQLRELELQLEQVKSLLTIWTSMNTLNLTH